MPCRIPSSAPANTPRPVTGRGGQSGPPGPVPVRMVGAGRLRPARQANAIQCGRGGRRHQHGERHGRDDNPVVGDDAEERRQHVAVGGAPAATGGPDRVTKMRIGAARVEMAAARRSPTRAADGTSGHGTATLRTSRRRPPRPPTPKPRRTRSPSRHRRWPPPPPGRPRQRR